MDRDFSRSSSWVASKVLQDSCSFGLQRVLRNFVAHIARWGIRTSSTLTYSLTCLGFPVHPACNVWTTQDEGGNVGPMCDQCEAHCQSPFTFKPFIGKIFRQVPNFRLQGSWRECRLNPAGSENSSHQWTNHGNRFSLIVIENNLSTQSGSAMTRHVWRR